MRLLLFGLLPFVAIACTVSANVGELLAVAPDASNDALGSDGSDGSANAADATPAKDAGPDMEAPPIDAGCGVSFAQRGSFIDVALIMGPTPNLTGGTIVAGIYELTAMRVYFSGSTGTMQVRETIRVRGSATAGAFDRLTEARNATGSFQTYALHGETETWQTGAGPGLFVTPECPKKDFETTGRYDMKGDTLTLFDDVDAIERVYRRVE